MTTYSAQPWIHSNYSKLYDHSAYNHGSCTSQNPYNPNTPTYHLNKHNNQQNTSNIHEKYLATLDLGTVASENDIKNAYKKLSSKYHPNKARNQQDKEARTIISNELKDAHKYLLIILDHDEWRNKQFN